MNEIHVYPVGLCRDLIALRTGRFTAVIAEAAGISRARVYQIRDGKR